MDLLRRRSRAAKARPIQLADSAYYQPPQATEPAFDYPVEYIRQDLEDRFTTRVAQTGLAVYSTINIAAQRKAYEVVRAGLRRYAGGSWAWRNSYEASQRRRTPARRHRRSWRLTNIPIGIAIDYDAGRYLKGLVMKVESGRDEATIRFGNYTRP
jgi:membrane carboxypeptidase/penicillin-binding protein